MASFWRYFWSAQLVMGIAMALRMFPEGMLGGGGISGGLLFAVGGLFVPIPVAVLIALGRLVYDRHQMKRHAQ